MSCFVAVGGRRERAIDRLAAELAQTLDPAWLAIATLVPIPPSRARTDPRHDDRMLRLLHRLADHLDAAQLAAHRARSCPSLSHLASGLDAGRPRHPSLDLGAASPGDQSQSDTRQPSRRAGDSLTSGLSALTLDIRELLVQRRTTSPAHLTLGRPTPADLAALYEIDDALASPPPRALGLFDDVLTTGAHFKAAQQVLLTRFPATPIAGIFLARTPHARPLPRQPRWACKS